MTTHRYRPDYKGPRRNIKDISNVEGSPCFECLVKSSCSRKITNGDACEDFIDYVFSKLKEISMGKSRGFTLLEVLIVLFILIILFAVGFSSCMAWYHLKTENIQSMEIITQEQENQTLMPIEIEPLNKSEGDKNKL